MGEVESQDALIIGGGLIGLATAYQLLRAMPHLRVVVLEREPRLACHQSGRVPGVIDSGIAGRCGPVLGELLSEGRGAMERFCDEQGVPWQRCGELWVARGGEEEWLRRIEAQAERTGIEAEWWNRDRLGEVTPQVAGSAGLWLRGAGIVDYATVCGSLVREIHGRGGQFQGNAEVTGLTVGPGSVRVTSVRGEFEAGLVVNCAGLGAVRLAMLAGTEPGVRMLPFRAAFEELDAEGRSLVDRLIRLVPRPGALFEPVRFIPATDGRVECGPDLAPAWFRGPGMESWETWRDLLLEPGIVPLLGREWKSLWEAQGKGWNRHRRIAEARELLPGLRAHHFDAATPGIFGRAMRGDGSFAEDLLVVRERRMIHVCHVPEAGATAALAIGRMVVGQGLEWLV